ncbi:hypothetical protein BH10CYA1_BH10CYA1_40560 [soil metagenome]
MQRLELEKNIEELEQSGADDQKLLDGLRDQLEWVNSLSQERFEPEIKVSDIALSKLYCKQSTSKSFCGAKSPKLICPLQSGLFSNP